jgi:microsomal dipeptidase-like Zn-dependent dipeptidase
MRSLFALLLATTCAFAIPSQRDTLLSAKREAQQAYTAAQRVKDKDQFLAAAGRFQEVGQKVMAANQAAMASINPNPPSDVKSRQALQTWNKKIADIRKSLDAANESLAGFMLPTEFTPESVRSVDRHIREIDKAIEAHHAACLNIR